MQTFLPRSSYKQSAQALDNSRLDKQIVECQQILSTITGKYPYRVPPNPGWKNHPVVLMWKDYPYQLYRYARAMHKEWQARRADETEHASFAFIKLFILPSLEKSDEKPWWFGNEDFHLSHRSNLLRKNPEFYRKHFPDDPDNLPYIWPCQKT